MNAVRIYILAWVLSTVIGAIVLSAAPFNDAGFLLLGMAFSSLAFLGPIAVLPVWIDEHHSPKRYPKKIASRT
jgi:hypothetical protein